MTINVRNILEKPEIREGLREIALWFWEQCVQFVENVNEKYGLDQLQHAELMDSFRSGTVSRATVFWREKITNQLGKPLILTSKDFKQAFANFLLRDATGSESQYEGFANCLANAATVRRSIGPFQVIAGSYLADPQFPTTIWANDMGFRVVLNGSLPLREEHFEPPTGFDLTVTSPNAVYIRVEGCCSSNALRQFRSEVCRVLRCILRSISLLKTFNHPGKRFIPWNRMVRLGQQANPPDDWLVEPLLNAYFSNPTKKDSIDRRVRNSLHLLVQSDQQNHTAVGIALSVAAIEALVCRKSGDIANMFADNTASILEPDPTYRAAAVDFAKDLYDARSRVLHGDMLEHEATTRRQARVFAAAVLKAILERRDFQRRAGVESETPDALLDELRRGKWVPGQLTGVSASPVRQLWGGPIEAVESHSDDDNEQLFLESDE